MGNDLQPDVIDLAAGGDPRARDDERWRVLDEVSAAVADAHDEASLFERLVAAVVPTLADGVAMRGRRGDERVQAAHRDPGGAGALAAMLDPASGLVGEVEQTGEGQVVSEGLDAIGARSAVVVAARARGETIGVVALVASERVYDESDRRAAAAIGRQVGGALAAMSLARQVAGERQRLHDLIDTIPGIVWETWGEPDGRTQRTNFVSEHVTEMIGYTPHDWLTTPNFWQTILHPDDHERAMRRARQKFDGRTEPGDAYGNEFRWIRRDGREIWVRSESTVVRGPDGAPIGMRGFTFDITTQRRAADTARFLAEVTAALVGSIDLRQTLREVTRRVVPRLADWCAIDLLDEAGQRLERVEVAHVDPEKVELAWQLWREFPVDLGAPRGPGEIMRTRRTQRVPVITPEMLAAAPMPERQRAMLLALGLRSSLLVPLVARGRVLGVLTLVAAESLRQFDESDQLFAEELAARLALGVDSATLFERLRASEQRYRSLVDVSSQTIWTTTPAGEMRGEQPGWAALTGQTREQYEGLGWASALHPDDRAAVVAAWNHAVEARTPYMTEHRVRTGDGSYHDIAARGVPVVDEDGRIREWVGVNTDISARKQAEREREGLIEALARSNQDLDQFAYIASHDLKAPLRGIANLSHWIEDDLSAVVTDEAREHLRLLRGRVQRLEGLIDGILSYSRAVRQRDPAERVDTGALVREVIELLAPPPTVHLRVAHEMPTIESERVPLQQVLMNLIGNALKYAGSTATIEVDARTLPDGMCEFRVTDDGPGIDPRYHERIWQIFQTLAARDKVESTGIGLAVVKKTVESHGGQVSLRSATGEGSTFAFTWPRSERRWRAPTSAR